MKANRHLDYHGDGSELAKISMPPIGTTLKKDHAGLTFSRADKETTAVSPITGSVLAINCKAQEHPEIVHEDPYH